MGIKKRNKVSAEFSMSSLTDIIFLLLIFFMLTSSLVAPNGLNLKLPGTSKTKVVTTSKMDKIRMRRNGEYYLNGKSITLDMMETVLASKARKASPKLDVILAPDKDTPVEYVVAVMDIVMRLNINGIYSAEE